MSNVPYVKLKELCDVNQGLQIPISKRFTEDGENRYFYITVQFLKDSHLEKYYVEKPPKSSICNQDDIIVVRTGSTGQVLTGINGCLHNNFFKVNHDKEKVLGKYLYYCLSSKEKQGEMKRRAGITTIPDLNHFMFLDMKIPLPQYSAQLAVVKILDELNSQIELNNKINAELEAMAKLIYDYWFVQFDFPDANGKPYKSSGGKMLYNKALKREIPEGWEARKLSEILKCNYSSIGKSFSKKKIEYLDTGSLTKNVIESSDLIDISTDKLPSRAKRIVSENDILYSTVRPNLCHYGIMKDPVDNLIASTGFAQLSSKIDSISNDLIYTYLTSSWITSRLHQVAALSVSAYPSISANDILDLDIVLPLETDSLKPINNMLNSIYLKMSLNQKENKELSELRDWLLPMLMNGQVSVRDVKTSEEKRSTHTTS